MKFEKMQLQSMPHGIKERALDNTPSALFLSFFSFNLVERPKPKAVLCNAKYWEQYFIK